MGVIWAMAFPILVVLLFLLAVLEVWGHRFLPWHRRGDGQRVASVTATEEIEAILGGTKHHDLEQRQVQLMLVDDEADGAPPRTHVDLDAGKFVVREP